jgi:hypothetical protein
MTTQKPRLESSKSARVKKGHQLVTGSVTAGSVVVSEPTSADPLKLGISETLDLADSFALYENTLPELGDVFSQSLSELEGTISTINDIVNDIKLNLCNGFRE